MIDLGKTVEKLANCVGKFAIAGIAGAIILALKQIEGGIAHKLFSFLKGGEK